MSLDYVIELLAELRNGVWTSLEFMAMTSLDMRDFMDICRIIDNKKLYKYWANAFYTQNVRRKYRYSSLFAFTGA